MFRTEKETEELLLSKTETGETLIEQTHRKPQETLEIELIHQGETFSFKSSNNPVFDSK